MNSVRYEKKEYVSKINTIIYHHIHKNVCFNKYVRINKNDFAMYASFNYVYS